MQKYIIIALFSSVLNIAFAQMVVPGYQGKRLSAEINANVMGNLSGPNAEGAGGISQSSFKYKRGLGLDIRYDLSVNYAVSRQYSLTLDYGMGQTGLFTSASATPFNSYGDLTVLHKVNFNHIGFGYNGFGKRAGGLAPIGNYFSIKALYITAQTERYQIAPLVNNYTYTGATAPEPILLTPAIEKTLYNLTTPSAQILNFQMGFGTRRILHKHLFFNFATFGGVSVNLKPQKIYTSATDANHHEAFADGALFTKMTEHYMFYFQFGIGHLIL